MGSPAILKETIPIAQRNKKMKHNTITKMKKMLAVLLSMLPFCLSAQQILTLEQCREMAVENDPGVEQAQTRIKMAEYDRKIALANYFPNIAATGTYSYNDHNINLINDEMSQQLTTVGTTVQNNINAFRENLAEQISSQPLAALEYTLSPMWQIVMGSISNIDVEDALNAIGSEIDDAFHLDIEHLFSVSVTVQQPLFMGGKIVASNQMAKLAYQLAETQYEQKKRDAASSVDHTYWQVVSIAAKRQLAEKYDTLLHRMEADVAIAVKEGTATEADALAIRVKRNEADMLLLKATNGLTLSRMLLCKQIGLPLDADIVLADESDGDIPMPDTAALSCDMEQVFANRPETRSLDLAKQIYAKKAAVARADMMPKLAVTGGYMMMNRDMRNGFDKKWSGMFNAGVILNVPIFHGCEALFKVKKAKYEATLYNAQGEEARAMITLQVAQLQKQLEEAAQRLVLTEEALQSSEENLRTANIGYSEGVIPANTVFAAQTDWLHAHSECIDASVELQLAAENLKRALGR